MPVSKSKKNAKKTPAIQLKAPLLIVAAFVTVILIVPLEPPLQDTFVLVVAMLGEPNCCTVAQIVAVQLFASVTVTQYVPAVRPVRSSVVAPPVHA